MKTAIFSFLILALLMISCKTKPENAAAVSVEADSLARSDLEAREDSLELARAYEMQSRFENRITADMETEPVASDEESDAADDPAIWYNRAHPEKSLVLGTDKKAGIYLYDLEGKMVQFRNVGRINNVDLRDGFQWRGKEVALVAGSNRTNNCISLFIIDEESGTMTDSILNIPSGVDEVYGLCMYRSVPDREFYVFVNGKGGMLEQWHIQATGDGPVPHLVRSLMLGSQPEGMVAHDANGMVYLGVEDEGVYRLDADPSGDTIPYKIPGSDNGNVNIAYDVEGLALFSYRNEDYLMVSVQGNFSYAIFKIHPVEEYVASFIITGDVVDGVEETDGLEVSTLPLNDRFSRGVMLVQDGFNTDGEVARSQNFKYVSFSKIEKLLSGK